LLLDKGYDVFGTTRRASTENVERIGHSPTASTSCRAISSV
jgi:GDP-D-mannose dehydratase